MHSNRIAVFLSILLAILTLAVAGVGIYTYRKLNTVVAQLKSESNPNYNLIFFKEITMGLSGLENDIESFYITGDSTYQNRYSQRIMDINLYLDSLKSMNRDDKELVRFCDSLIALTERKVELLRQFSELDNNSMDGAISELSENLKNLPLEANAYLSDTSIQKLADTLARALRREERNNELAKKNLFQRIFSRKDKEPEQAFQLNLTHTRDSLDSLLHAKKEAYEARLESEIQQLKRQNKVQLGIQKRQELAISHEHQEIQNKIINIITFLESREITKIKINTLRAQHLADETNSQVFIFSVLITIFLTVTIVVMWNHFQKNRAYQKILRNAKKDAETLAQTKEQFLANMSHEIRSPMNAISGFSDQLLKSVLTPKQREQMEIISKSSDHLLHLLNDILDLSKLQVNKLRLEKDVYELPGLIKEVVCLLASKAEEKNINLHYSVKNLPQWVIGDQYRLRQILLNLIHNGIKFTHQGEVLLEVSATSRNKKRVSLNLSVKDTGIGIPKSMHEKIFEEFEQGDPSSFSKGTGLGLAITKKLVKLHHGQLKLRSTPGKGTEINISMPYEIAMEEDLKPICPQQFEYDLKGLRILIADDEPYNRKLLATIFENQEVHFDECADGLAAIRKLEQKEYDLALLDLRMPGMSGSEIVKKIRTENGPNKDTVLIAITATISQEEHANGIRAGFDHIMKKPFDERDLFDIIAKETRRAITPQPDGKSIPLQAPPTPAYNLDGLHSMGDHFFVMDMVQTFIESAEKGMNNLETYVLAEDWEKVANEAHKIVAPARHLEATQLVKALKKLEQRALKSDTSINKQDLQEIESLLNTLTRELRKHINGVKA